MDEMMKIEVKLLDSELYSAEAPTRATADSAAIDLRAAFDAEIKPGETLAMDTGIAIHLGAIYEGEPKPGDLSFAALVLPRSGLGSKQGLVLGNLVGLVDEDYQGPVTCYLWNRNERETGKSVFVKRGDRIAQLVIVPVVKPAMTLVTEFTASTERGEKGFGSSGVK